MSTTRIAGVLGGRVWDSRGRPTDEVDVPLEGGAMGRAIAPAGASRGSMEAVDLRDGGDAFGGLDVRRAIAGIGAEISNVLVGLDSREQEVVDSALVSLDNTENKARLGGNATVAVSMATAHAAANVIGVPLWQYLGGNNAGPMPLPEIQIFGGGAHAARALGQGQPHPQRLAQGRRHGGAAGAGRLRHPRDCVRAPPFRLSACRQPRGRLG